jgi:hypothetical protein
MPGLCPVSIRIFAFHDAFNLDRLSLNLQFTRLTE